MLFLFLRATAFAFTRWFAYSFRVGSARGPGRRLAPRSSRTASQSGDCGGPGDVAPEYCGWLRHPFRTTQGNHGAKTLFANYLPRESSETRVSQGVQDFVHPQYVSKQAESFGQDYLRIPCEKEKQKAIDPAKAGSKGLRNPLCHPRTLKALEV